MSIIILLTHGQQTIVDDEYAYLAELKWSASYHKKLDKYYARRWNGQKAEYLHRVILSAMLHRPLERTEDVDHINRDRLDNRCENLRLATRSQNNMNSKMKGNNVSGFRGVSWGERNKKWVARITISGKVKHLGLFTSKESAARAFDAAAKKAFGDFARLNFEEEV